MKPINFKLGIITSGMLLGAALMGCSHSVPEVKDASGASIVMTVPADAHLVWCKGGPEDCFDAAGSFCSSDKLEGMTATQHPQPGAWHQAPEVGMVFPAMIQEKDHSWRMLFVCDSENATR